MAARACLFNSLRLTGRQPLTSKRRGLRDGIPELLKRSTIRNLTWGSQVIKCSSTCMSPSASLDAALSFTNAASSMELLHPNTSTLIHKVNMLDTFSPSDCMPRLVLADLDPATAKLAIGFLGPFLSVFGFLFILRIVMSWYPKLPVDKFPYVIAYAPTEPLLVPTRKIIPPLAGVDVTPVVWFGLVSFLNEILVGPQGLLVLLSQQVS